MTIKSATRRHTKWTPEGRRARARRHTLFILRSQDVAMEVAR
jgi:hypothetical protein